MSSSWSWSSPLSPQWFLRLTPLSWKAVNACEQALCLIHLRLCPVLEEATVDQHAVLSRSVVSDSLWPHGLWPARLLCPWDSPGKDTEVGCHALFQGIFLTQELNPGLQHCRQILYRLSHQGSPLVTAVYRAPRPVLQLVFRGREQVSMYAEADCPCSTSTGWALHRKCSLIRRKEASFPTVTEVGWFCKAVRVVNGPPSALCLWRGLGETRGPYQAPCLETVCVCVKPEGLLCITDSLEKTLMLGKMEDRRRRGWQDEMVGWHHQLNGHEFEPAPGDGEGQGSLAFCSPWGCKELDTTERLNNNNKFKIVSSSWRIVFFFYCVLTFFKWLLCDLKNLFCVTVKKLYSNLEKPV